MKDNKVFVLVVEIVKDEVFSDEVIEVKVFYSLEDAKKELKNIALDSLQDIDEDFINKEYPNFGYVYHESDLSFELYAKGYYESDHTIAYIKEREIK